MQDMVEICWNPPEMILIEALFSIQHCMACEICAKLQHPKCKSWIFQHANCFEPPRTVRRWRSHRGDSCPQLGPALFDGAFAAKENLSICGIHAFTCIHHERICFTCGSVNGVYHGIPQNCPFKKEHDWLTIRFWGNSWGIPGRQRNRRVMGFDKSQATRRLTHLL